MASEDDQEVPLVESDDEDDNVTINSYSGARRKKQSKSFRYITLAMAIFAGGVLISLVITILVKKSPKPKPKAQEQYAVSSDSDTCAAVGAKILQQGGSAVDSAIATLFCLGVVHPHSSGIGGGGFMVVHNHSNTTAYNFRESAPKAAHANMYNGNASRMLIGGLAVAVPGEVKGLEHVHRLYGVLPWKDLVMPAVDLARNGFPVEKTLRHALAATLNTTKHSKYLTALFAPFRAELMPNGTIPDVGSTVTRRTLAQTLSAIAVNKSAALYSGSIAQSIVDAVTDKGGILTIDDLKNYTVKEQVPVVSSLANGWKMYGAPLPASGPVLTFMSNVIAGYGGINGSVLSAHRIVEAFKFAYAQRSFLGDPGFIYSPGVEDLVTSKLANATYAAWVRSRISDSHTHKNISYYGGEYDVEQDAGTTHVSVVRGQVAVSVTSTINTYFGALVMTSSGIVLNNEMDDFAAPNITNFFGLPPSPPNFVEANKRPLSSQSPTIVCDEKGDVRLVVGASGGTHITTSVYQVYAKVHLESMSVYDAVLKPRFHHQLIPEYVMAEKALANDLVVGLRGKQHKVHNTYDALAVVQAIERTRNGTLRGQADVVRKGGACHVGTVTVS